MVKINDENNVDQRVAIAIQSIPQEIFDMIFNYLDDWQDYISMSLTSTKFNLAVVNSKKFASKSTVKLNPVNVNEEISQTFSGAEIDSVNILRATKKIVQICSKSTNLVKLKNIRIVNRLDLFNFLNLPIFDHLERLELKDIHVCDKASSFFPQSFEKDLKFLNLKKLSFVGKIDNRLIIDLLKCRSENLEELEFDVCNLPQKYDDFDKNLENNCDRMETLKLTGDLDPKDLIDEDRLPQFIKHFVRPLKVQTISITAGDIDRETGLLNESRFKNHFIHNHTTKVEMTYSLFTYFEVEMVQFYFSGLKRLTIDYIGEDFADVCFPDIEELEIINFRCKQLKILQSFGKQNEPRKVKVWILRGFPKFESRIFNALHAIVKFAKVFEVFDGQKIHRKTNHDIELKNYRRILLGKHRLELFENWKEDKELKKLDKLLLEPNEHEIFKPISRRRNIYKTPFATRMRLLHQIHTFDY